MTHEIIDSTKVTGTLNVTDAVDLDTTLNVNGAVDLDSTLNVDGVTTLASLNSTQMNSGATLTLASGGMNMGNAGGTTVTAGARPELVAGGGIDADGFLKLTGDTQTISGGVITVTKTYNSVDTQAAAATDDLDTINGGVTGAIVILRAASNSRDVVIKDGTGNIRVPSDRTLTHSEDMWMAIYNGSAWCEISFADNTA